MPSLQYYGEIPFYALNILLCSFFLLKECCLGGGTAKILALMAEELTTSLGPWRSLYATFSAPLQSYLVCFYCPCMFYAAFILFGQMMW